MKNLKLKSVIILKFGTQFDFSRVVGLREDRISKLIHGRVIPTQDEKEIIGRALGVNLDEIFPVS